MLEELYLKFFSYLKNSGNVGGMSEPFIEKLKAIKHLKIVDTYSEKPSQPKFGPEVEKLDLSQPLCQALKSRGIKRLFEYQHTAIENIFQGKNVVISAGTGLGKTEAFIVPILADIFANPFSPRTLGLIIYPTKALARDQLERINSYMSFAFGARAMVLDGDTPEKVRREIYSHPPHILITNPDMIHFSLQYSRDFKDLVSTVKYIVLDDAHVYAGVFGSHVAYVIRRLKRFTPEAQFIVASATIGDPKNFAETLVGEHFIEVSTPPSRKNEIIHILAKPEGISKTRLVTELMKTCVEHDLKTIIFVDSHKLAEILKILGEKTGIKVGLHRAGLKPEERKKVEQAFKKGSVKVIIATPTLELGIDIGDLDVAILYNIPPTMSKYIQRTGRVGRRERKGYVITILGDDPISAYFERHPSEFFNRPLERQVVTLENEEVAKIHMLAMARDKPYSLEELSHFERRIAETLLADGFLALRRRTLRITRKGARFLSERQSLRGVGEVIKIVTRSGRVIGYREMPMALKELHPGAVYLHGGRPYISLDLTTKRAIVEPLPRDYPFITKPLFYSDPKEIEMYAEKRYRGIYLRYVNLAIKDAVFGYVVKRFPGMENVREVELDKEYTYIFKTKGVFIYVEPESDWDLLSNAEAFHAIEHALISAAEIVIGAAPTDLGGISFPSGHIYIHDAYPGGSGVSAEFYRRIDEIVEKAFDIVSRCQCIDGCPRCIFSPYCGNNNKILSRRKAHEKLRKVLQLEFIEREVSVEHYGKPLV